MAVQAFGRDDGADVVIERDLTRQARITLPRIAFLAGWQEQEEDEQEPTHGSIEARRACRGSLTVCQFFQSLRQEWVHAICMMTTFGHCPTCMTILLAEQSGKSIPPAEDDGGRANFPRFHKARKRAVWLTLLRSRSRIGNEHLGPKGAKDEAMKNYRLHKLTLASLLLLAGLSTSCVPLAAGAAGGYMLRDEGYEVQSPVEKD